MHKQVMPHVKYVYVCMCKCYNGQHYYMHQDISLSCCCAVGHSVVNSVTAFICVHVLVLALCFRTYYSYASIHLKFVCMS